MNDHQEASAVQAHASAALEDIFSALEPDLRDAVGRMIGEDAPALAEQFYSVLLHDEEAKGYLSHDVVNRRLRASMQRWITQIFNFEDVDFAGVISKQIEVGAVHARIKLAPHMMAMGMRVLTGGMRRVVDRMPLPPDQALRVHLYVTDLMHLADGLIMSAFVRELQKAVRNDEHYRMTGLRQDISLERERQRAALSDWVNRLLFALHARSGMGRIEHLAESEFGAWLKHKSQLLFDEHDDLEPVLDTVDEVDRVILPQLLAPSRTPEDTEALLEDLRGRIEFVRYLLSDLFERLVAADHGRDATTGLQNRRHLSAVLSRELEQHASSGSRFSLLLVKIDNLDLAAGTEEARTLFLRQIAALIVDFVRAGDHAFRFADDQFLVLAVETDRERANEMAHDLRSRIWAHSFAAKGSRPVRITASVGVVTYDGHPDYQHIVKRAEHAIARALRGGGNQVAEVP